VGRKDYAYAHQNPLRYTDSSGHVANVIVGAALGAAIGFGVSVLTQAMGNEDFSWKKAGAAAAGGAISGAVAGATMGGSLLLEAGGAVASGMVGGATTRALMGEKTTAKDLLIDGAIAGITFGVVKGVTSASANGQMTAAIKELQKETAANVAAKAAPIVVEEAAEQAGAVTRQVDEMGQSFTATGAEVEHGEGFTRIGADERSVNVAKNVAREPGYHDVVVHGAMYDEGGAAFHVSPTPEGAGLPTHANQIADQVLSNPSYRPGQPIRLLTCWGACGPAQELSNLVGAEVKAASQVVGVARAPNSAARILENPATGEQGWWKSFFPRIKGEQ
jgi:hypothetical protein